MNGNEIQESDDEDWNDTNWDQPVDSENPGETAPSRTVNPIDEKMNTDNPNPSRETSESVSKPSSLMTRMELNDHKAGMEGLDKAKINQIIYEASKGSKYFENEKKKEEQMKERIEEQKRRMEKITPDQIQHGLKHADVLLSELERSFDLSRYIVHVDMDAFYAAVEMRDNPSLRYKPMAVGGMGMLSTSNYLARKFGVRAAMPGFIGLKLCPNLVLVKSNHEKYSAVSKEIRAVMVDYDPNYCPLSLDEAYLDFTDHMKTRETSSDKDRSFLVKDCSADDKSKCICDLNSNLRKSVIFDNKICLPDEKCVESGDEAAEVTVIPESPVETENKSSADNNDNDVEFLTPDSTQFSNSSQIEQEMLLTCPVCNKPYPQYKVKLFDKDIEDAVNEMRCRIEQRTRLTASAGIAPNMMLAKVCSDKKKPNGQYRISASRDSIREFIDDLPIRKISGIGKISEQMLNALGVLKCHDLYQHRALLYHLYSETSFHYFMRICLGLGSTIVERDSERKSMSTERTFRDMSNPNDLYDKCLELSESLSKDLTEEGLKGKTVTLKLKTSTFEVKTRAQTLPDYIWDQETIYNTCKELLRIEIASAQPKPLTLRLMGVRMSNLLHHTACSKSKQETLTGFLKKMSEKPSALYGKVQSEPIIIEDSTKWDNGSTNSLKSPSKENFSTLNTKFAKYPSPKKMDKKNNETSCKDLFSSSKLICPVCNKEIYCGLNGMSLHVEKCLQGENSKEIIVEGGPASNSVYQDMAHDQPQSSKPSTSSCETNQLSGFTCPICNQQKQCSSLEEFNLHVDACLSKDTIKQILQQQKSSTTEINTKKRRLNGRDKKSDPVSKKKKTNSNSKVKTKSIESFFKS